MENVINEYNRIFKEESVQAAQNYIDSFFKNCELSIAEKVEIRDQANVIKRAFDEKQAKLDKKAALAIKRKQKALEKSFAYSEFEANKRFDIPVYDAENKRWYDAEY